MHIWYVLAWVSFIVAGLAALASGLKPPRPTLPWAVFFLALGWVLYLVPLVFKIHSA